MTSIIVSYLRLVVMTAMKKRTLCSIAIFIFSFLHVFMQNICQATEITQYNTPTKICSSLKGDCIDIILNQIDNAKSEILIQAYSFTSKEIAAAVIKAHKRGVNVEVVMDKSNRNNRDSAGDVTTNAGIATYIDTGDAIPHNKIMIIDKETVITGIFNFIAAARDNNTENVLMMKDKSLIRIYIENWVRHKGHSEKYLSHIQ
jgi:phosphatidylserine/phosphatidylglycerophosphate/cardiolipin synthase-like enzyme